MDDPSKWTSDAHDYVRRKSSEGPSSGGDSSGSDPGCQRVVAGAVILFFGISWILSPNGATVRTQIVNCLPVVFLLLVLAAIWYAVNRMQWEYKDFVWQWQESPVWYEVALGEAEPQARTWFWNNLQTQLLPELQKRQAEGWELMSEAGPAAFVLTKQKRFLGMKVRYETKLFRVKMRRRKSKTSVVAQPTQLEKDLRKQQE